MRLTPLSTPAYTGPRLASHQASSPSAQASKPDAFTSSLRQQRQGYNVEQANYFITALKSLIADAERKTEKLNEPSFSTYLGSLRIQLKALEIWVKNPTGPRPRKLDLRGADLKGANLGEADLEEANLRMADLKGANLRMANLRGAKLGGANLTQANLRTAILEGARLQSADCTNANLTKAHLKNAIVDFCNFFGANLNSADLTNVDAKNAIIWGHGSPYSTVLRKAITTNTQFAENTELDRSKAALDRWYRENGNPKA